MKMWYAHRGNIRYRLLRSGLGIILLIGLLSFGTGGYFWKMIDTATEIRNSTGKMLTQMSLARNAEKDFRLSDLLASEFYQSVTTKGLVKHHAALSALEAEIQALQRLLPDEDEDLLHKLQELVDGYRGVFTDLVAAYRNRGFKEWGLEGEWRRSMHEVGGYVAGTQNVFALRALLALASHEKDYLLQNEPQSIEAIRNDLQQLKRMMLAQSETLSTTVLKAVEEYETAFTSYILTQQAIGVTEDVGLQGELQRSGQALEPVLQAIRQKAIEANDRARNTFLQVISLIWIVGLSVCGMILYFHAKSITQPIIQLKEAAVKISHGDFDIRLPIASDDEVGVLARSFKQMASDLERTQQALKESEEQSRSILETASDAFIAMDQNEFITDWNRQAEVIFGWSHQEAIGRRLSETVIPARYQTPHSTGLQRFLATGIGPVLNKRVELTALHRDGREFPVELTVWPIQSGQAYRFNAFIHDITERKQTEEAIRQSEQRFRTLTTHAPVGIFLTDAEGDYLFVNKRWCEIAGITPEDATGRGWAEALHREDRQRVSDEWYTAVQAGREVASEYRYQPRQGEAIWVYSSAVALRDDTGQITGYLGTVTNITERKQAEQMKSDFVSFVTHQLRTPLAGIKWLLELAAEEGEVPPETLSYIQDARESAERLITLVNDLLDISRLERGKLTITPQEIQLGALTQSVLEEVGPLIQEQGHRLSVISADSIPPVLMDQQLMRQVILNLTSNAIKYTPPNGEIAIEIGREGSHLRWSIHDSGIGIPKEALPRLFEKFYRAENALTVETEGTGLGLYLVRLILEQCAGRIWCESEEGKGTTFHFTLPLPEKDR
jgi:PAS domain S-box-containing protein